MTGEPMHADPIQLQAEADAALSLAPPDPAAAEIPGAEPAPAGPSPEEMEQGYAMLAGAALDMTFEMAAPAWEVTDAEKSKLADALGKACALWFPGEIPAKYVALIVVAGSVGQIVAARRDPSTGRLKPRHRTITIEPPPKD
jgi:hypothetical protein